MKRTFISLLGKKFPRKIKRLIYISSLAATLKQIDTPDNILSKQLNNIFKIARYPDAILFPMYIKSLIWTDLDKEVINLANKENVNIEENILAEKCTKVMPKWLVYDSMEKIKLDTSLVIHNLSNLQTA